jgi:PIN domain nuclease of toxin-antitoxin system
MPKSNSYFSTLIMRILLDTCIIYDWMMGRIADSEVINQVEDSGAFVSPVSVWEMAIKHSLGKLLLPSKNPAQDIEAQGFMWLNITPYHAERVIELDLNHKDPFDRLLIAQAMHESMCVLTYDTIFRCYLKDVTIVRR